MSINPTISGKTKVTICYLFSFDPSHKKMRTWYHMNKYRNIASIFFNDKITNFTSQVEALLENRMDRVILHLHASVHGLSLSASTFFLINSNDC